MNNCVFAGRLTRDPELKTANSGTELCNFTIAVDRRRKGQNGEKEADFVDCTAWGKTGVFVNTYFKKGDGVTVSGRMESDKWTDRDGNKRISWKCQIDTVEFPLGRTGGGDQGQSYHRAANGALDVATPKMQELPDGEEGDLPF